MPIISDLLTPAWIDNRISIYYGNGEIAKFRRTLEARITAHGQKKTEQRWEEKIRDCRGLCDLKYARGEQPETIREMCRDLIVSFLPQMKKLDFSLERTRAEDGLSPKEAKHLAEQYGGKWWKSSPYWAGVEYWSMNQPYSVVMPDLWMMAAVAGDHQLARNMDPDYSARSR